MNSASSLAVLSAQLNPDVGDIRGNVELAERVWKEGAERGADLVVLPELFLSGYPPQDLVLRSGFVLACREGLRSLAASAAGPGLLVGLPYAEGGRLYNAVALVHEGEVRAVRFKHELPDYGVFDEKRLFSSGPLPEPVFFTGWGLGFPICEDLWHDSVAQTLAQRGAQILIAANGSPWRRGKRRKRLQSLRRAGLPLIWVNRVGGQDELVFDGASFALGGGGELVQQLPDFETCLSLSVWDSSASGDVRCIRGECCSEAEGTGGTGGAEGTVGTEEETYRAIVLGLRDYVLRSGFREVLLGLSGGVDSALAAALCVDALGSGSVHSVMLPWRHTSRESVEDAQICAQSLGIEHREVQLAPAVEGLEEVLRGHCPGGDSGALARENMQARVRGLILMTLSNARVQLLITTGNRSEIASGYMTLYGDMCGGYNPLKGLYKGEVYKLASWRNGHVPVGGLGSGGEVIPERILYRAPSAELRPDQTDQDSLPDYPLLDEVLRELLEEGADRGELLSRGYCEEMLSGIIGRLYGSEHKRYQASPGPRVGEKDFGRDRRYPINHGWREGF